MTATLTWSGVTARRMARHALAEPSADLGPDGVAGLLCGAHAQVLSAAELSIGRRIAGATRADVRHALWQERTLVKTFGPRGTVHLLPAADLPMWTGALSVLPSPVPIHPEGVRFTPGQADEVIAAIGEAVTGVPLIPFGADRVKFPGRLARCGHVAAAGLADLPKPLIAIGTEQWLIRPPAHVIGVTVAIPFYGRQNGNL